MCVLSLPPAFCLNRIRVVERIRLAHLSDTGKGKFQPKLKRDFDQIGGRCEAREISARKVTPPKRFFGSATHRIEMATADFAARYRNSSAIVGKVPRPAAPRTQRGERGGGGSVFQHKRDPL